MADGVKKIRMKVSRGNPSGGPIIRAGAVIELSDYWADKFIKDGSAEEIKDAKSRDKGKRK